MLKLPLKKRKDTKHDKELRALPINWKATLPFVENTRAYLIHRPMSVTTFRHFRNPHLAVYCYCGNGFCGTKNLTFLSAPQESSVVCARCENAAIAAGLPSSSELAGRHVHTGGLKVVLDCKCESSQAKEQP